MILILFIFHYHLSFNWLWDLKWYHLFHSWYYLYLLSYNCHSCWRFISLVDIFEKPNSCFLGFSLMFSYPQFHWFLLLYLLFLFISLVLLGECVISLVLSHCNKNLKPWTDQCYCSVLLGKTKASTHLRSEGGPTQKMKRREASILLGFLL